MEELTYEEKLKLADSKEHLQVVLGNIRDANKKLMGLISIIEQLSEKISVLQNEKNTLKEDIQLLSIQLEEKKISLDAKEKAIIDRESKLDFKEKEIIDSKNQLEQIKNRIAILAKQHTDGVKNHTQKIDELKFTISDLERETKEHEETKKIKLRDKKIVENEINNLTSTKERAERELSNFQKSSDIKMRTIVKEIADEQSKIKIPLEVIRLESKKLEVFREDLNILQARLIEQFKLQNPDKQLPLELQNKIK